MSWIYRHVRAAGRDVPQLLMIHNTHENGVIAAYRHALEEILTREGGDCGELRLWYIFGQHDISHYVRII